MFYVYIIRSQNKPDQTYVGFTRELKQRLLMHNQDRSPHTAKFSPWQIEFYCAFKREEKALAFECYLKSNSGKAFASKRLLQTDFRSELRQRLRAQDGVLCRFRDVEQSLASPFRAADGLEHVPQSLTNLIWHGTKNKMR